jgi:ubiquinone/menaquinone biosynthesis C-methylase UbiE
MNTYKEKVKERFDELADSYTNNAVSYIRNKRLNLINKHIKKEDKVLEIGCGSGNILKLINSKNIYGLDISPKMIEFCKKTIPHGNFISGDAENLPYEDNFFDKVIISEVLYYLPDLEKAMEEAKRVLKKEGLLLITSLNRKYNFIKTIVNVLKIGVHDNVSMSYISLNNLKNIIQKNFKIEEISPIPLKVVPANYSLIFFIAARK